MITSVENAQVKMLTKLQMKKYRDRLKQCIIEGEHVVDMAQKAGLLEHVFSLEPHPNYPDPTCLSLHVMKKVTQTQTVPSIIGLCKTTLNEAVGERVLFLERIQDPGNMGALIRSAAAFNFNALVLDQCVDLFNPKVLRATQGALFQMSVKYLDAQTFKEQHPHHQLFATVTRQTRPRPVRPKGPFALLLGHEGQGLAHETRLLADGELTIPMGNFESLNVSVAGAILMQAIAGKPIFETD